jgi:haloalkane dehalogenase
VRGLAFMEFVRPWPTWDKFTSTPEIQKTFQMFRTPDEGERLILEENIFVEQLLPGAVARGADR